MKTKAVTISLLLFSFVCLTSCSNTTYSGAYPFSTPVRISLQWYRHSGELVPRGADAWYRLYRLDGTGTKRPLHTLLSNNVKEP